MSDLIDRQAAIDAVNSLCDDCDASFCGPCRVDYPGEKAVRKVLEGLPSAERKKGRWILTQDDDYEYCTCSVCGYQNGENWMNGSDIPFCAMCGADMREIV